MIGMFIKKDPDLNYNKDFIKKKKLKLKLIIKYP